MMENLHRLVISCGGTGGHFYPGLSLARTFQRDGGDVRLLLGGKHVESQAKIAESFGVGVEKLGPMPSPGHLANAVPFARGCWHGCAAAVALLRMFRPEAVLGMGSFASLPLTWAAYRCRVPLFLHDGNARIGKANRWFSRWAVRLDTAFPAVNAAAAHCPVGCVGMPLRPELRLPAPGKAAAVAELNRLYHSELRAERPTVLVFGGSQGALAINRALPQGLALQPNRDFQVIHLAGEAMAGEVRAAYEQAGIAALVLAGCDRMELCYAAAGLVVARAGGSTVAELICFGKFAILVPYPYAAELHQDDNAAYLRSLGAAEIWRNAECTPERVRDFFTAFLAAPDSWQQRGAEAKKAALPDAAEQELALIDTWLGRKRA